MTHPDELTAGEEIEISIDTAGDSGGIWYKFYGNAECSVLTYTLAQKTINIPQTNLVRLTVPIGENITQNASSDQITIYTQREDYSLYVTDFYVQADVRIKFDFEITTSSYVVGDVSCTGGAIQVPVNENHVWGSTYTTRLDVKSSAEPGDSIDISVINMKYVLEKVQVKIKAFYVYAGYYSDSSVIGTDADAITTMIDVSNFVPKPGTRADNRVNGELINTFDEVPVVSDFTASLAIPYPDNPGGGDDSGGLSASLLLPLALVLIIVVVATVGTMSYMRGKGAKAPQAPIPIQQTQGTQGQQLSQQPGPPVNCIYCGNLVSAGAPFCGNCGKSPPPG